MTALDSLAHLASPGLARAACGRLQAALRTSGALLRRPSAVGSLRRRRGNAPLCHERHALLGQGRLSHSALEVPRVVTPVVDVGPRAHRPERQGPGVTGEGEGRPTLTALHGTRPRRVAPCCDGFLESSRRMWSPLSPGKASSRWARYCHAVRKGAHASQTVTRRWTVLEEGKPLGSLH